MSSPKVIQQFGKDDFNRLVKMGHDDVKQICEVPIDLERAAHLLRQLIERDQLFLMDKESGAVFEASVVIGYGKNGLLLANER